ncbi:MAG: ABC transporter permease, partial [Bacteroidetes bacterium]|nr:ABC transporter permease [Bacteroidota bacterium]
MSQQYSQFKAMMAITKGSLRAIFRSPSAVVFSFGFPLIFILVFGFIGGGGTLVKVALKNATDSNNYVIKALNHSPVIKFIDGSDSVKIRKDLEKGRLT